MGFRGTALPLPPPDTPGVENSLSSRNTTAHSVTFETEFAFASILTRLLVQPTVCTYCSQTTDSGLCDAFELGEPLLLARGKFCGKVPVGFEEK